MNWIAAPAAAITGIPLHVPQEFQLRFPDQFCSVHVELKTNSREQNVPLFLSHTQIHFDVKPQLQ